MNEFNFYLSIFVITQKKRTFESPSKRVISIILWCVCESNKVVFRINDFRILKS